MYGYIYKTTNLINNKIYIGQHKATKPSKTYKGSGKIILKAFKKYGKDNFSCKIICWCNSFDELNNQEKYYIKLYKEQYGKLCYNIAEGGSCGDLRKYLSEEEIEDWKKSISESRTGQKRTEESKRKQSETMQGHTTPQETRDKIRIANTGHDVSDYVRQRVSESTKGREPYNKGIPCTQEHKDAQSKSMSGRQQVEKDGKWKPPPLDQLQYYLDNGWKLKKK